LQTSGKYKGRTGHAEAKDERRGNCLKKIKIFFQHIWRLAGLTEQGATFFIRSNTNE
jgi:hypothetical protein